MKAQNFRILMISRYFPPEYSGTALQAIALAKELRRRGHYIEFVTQTRPGLPAHEKSEGFQVSRLEAGHAEKHQEFRFWWNLFRFLAARRHDFDFVHNHSAYYTDAIVGPYGRWLGMKTLAKASLAENDLYSIGKHVNGRLHRYMLRKIDACVAISQDLKAEFTAAGVDNKRLHFLPNGVDITRFKPANEEEKRAIRERLGLPLTKPIALYVGVFDARKNIEWLMQQWAANDAFGTETLLLAVGPQARDDQDGHFRNGLIALANRHPAIMQVHAPTSAVEDYYRAADFFILPSRQEGLPNALLEAMACGLPAVAARASGTRELVQQDQTGNLYTVDDPAALAAAVSAVTGEQATQMGIAARALVEQQYSLDALAASYEALYAKMLHAS